MAEPEPTFSQHFAHPDRRKVAGRGLFVVAALVDELQIVDDGDRHALRCRRRA